MFAHTASVSQASVPWQIPPTPPAPPPPSAPSAEATPQPDPEPAATPEKRDRKRLLITVGAAAAAVLLVISGIFIFTSRDKGGDAEQAAPTRPTVEAQPEWKPIADARVARDAVAATEADGTIWVFGGMGAGNQASGAHEGFDPAIDSWKGGEDLPVPVQHAMAVTWEDTPVVLGGWRTDGTNQEVATDKVWRVVNSRWVELAATVAAPRGSRGRRGRRPPHRHRRCGCKREAAEHHRDLRRHRVEARCSHTDATPDVGRGVRRQARIRGRWHQRQLGPDRRRGV